MRPNFLTRLIVCTILCCSYSSLYAQSVAAEPAKGAIQNLGDANHSIASTKLSLLDAMRAGTVSLGVASRHPPFSFVDERGIPQGYAYQLCTRLIVSLAASHSIAIPSIVTVALKPAQRERALMQGRVNLLCDANVINKTRAVTWTRPIFIEPMVLISTTEKKYADLNELKYRRIGVISGTNTAKTLIEANLSRQLALSIEPLTDFDTALNMLEKKQIDALWTSITQISNALKTLPAIFQWTRLDKLGWPLGLALRANDAESKQVVNQELSRLSRTGEWEKIYRMVFEHQSAWTLPMSETQKALLTDEAR